MKINYFYVKFQNTFFRGDLCVILIPKVQFQEMIFRLPEEAQPFLINAEFTVAALIVDVGKAVPVFDIVDEDLIRIFRSGIGQCY